MSRGRAVNQEEAIAMVNLLCWKLNLKPVPVQWVNRKTGRGHYEPPKKRKLPLGQISFSQPVDEMAVVHEVAHYVVNARAPKYTKREMRRYSGLRRGYQQAPGWGESSRRNPKSWHGPAFVDTIKELATIWWGDWKRYPWIGEYASVKKLAAR